MRLLEITTRGALTVLLIAVSAAAQADSAVGISLAAGNQLNPTGLIPGLLTDSRGMSLFITNSQMDPRAEQALATVAKRGYDFDAVRESWQTIAKRAGVRFADLTDTFRERRDEALFGQIDRHWNARGQQLAAEAIARALAEHP